MTASSSEEPEFYSAPEIRELLSKTRRIRREVTRIGAELSDNVAYNRLLKSLDDLEESLNVHFKELYGLERELMVAASGGLTKKQKAMLSWLMESYREESVYTVLIERMSEELTIPKSTVRWNLRGLRETGLIRAGDRNNKGVPVKLTEKGMAMAECLSLEPQL